jgi:hypothetical protein
MEFKTNIKKYHFDTVDESTNLLWDPNGNTNTITIPPDYDQLFNTRLQPPTYRTYVSSFNVGGPEAYDEEYLGSLKIRMAEQMGREMYLNGFFETTTRDGYSTDRKEIIMKIKIKEW